MVDIPVYWFCLQTLVLGNVCSTSYNSRKRLKLPRCPHLKEKTGTESNNYLLSTMFSLKIWNIFLHYTYCAIKFVYGMVPSTMVETMFLWYLEIIYHIDFKCGSIIFLKQRRQSAVPGHDLFNIHIKVPRCLLFI